MHAGRSILAPYLWMLSLALPASERPAYLDPAQPVAKRVSDVLKRMTLEDKIAQMNLWWSGKDEGAERGSAEGALRAVVESLPGLTGSIRTPGILFGFAQRMKPDVAFQVELRNQVQELAVRSSRLKIPVLWVEEGAHGVGVPGATMFPQPIALGSTWDVDLVEQIGRAMGEEANALGIHQLCMSPVLDVYRDVRMGRTEQGYGEDPYLVARMGVAQIRGIQSQGVIATASHFAGQGEARRGIERGPAEISERTFREICLRPFEAAVKEAGVLSVMAAYNEVGGVPCHANRDLLTGMLRREWGSRGYVMADSEGVEMLHNEHFVAPTMQDAGRQAVDAGVDANFPNSHAFGDLLARNVREAAEDAGWIPPHPARAGRKDAGGIHAGERSIGRLRSPDEARGGGGHVPGDNRGSHSHVRNSQGGRLKKFALVLLASAALHGAQHAKNVILFLGDGTGIPTLSAASIYGYGKPIALYVQNVPYIGLAETSSAYAWITDSAAGMTAIVTGAKTNNLALSETAEAWPGKREGAPLKTILEYAEEHGLSTGVVSNSAMVDATPAACYAYVNDRRLYAEIFLQALHPRYGDGVDVILGPGRKGIANAVAARGVDLREELSRRGYRYLESPAALDGLDDKARRVVALFDNDQFDLGAVTDHAIAILSRNPKGFFLMVESNNHWKDARKSLELTVAFDKVIRRTAERMKQDILILFTADHSYDLRLINGRRDQDILPHVRVDDAHAGEEVLVAAEGPGAEQVHGIFPNTHLFHIMLEAYGWRE